MITRISEFQAAPDLAEELHAFLGSLVPYITASDGCLTCEVLRHTEQQDTFVVIERWESVEAHRTSVESFPKEEMEAAMRLIGAPPKAGYYRV